MTQFALLIGDNYSLQASVNSHQLILAALPLIALFAIEVHACVRQ